MTEHGAEVLKKAVIRRNGERGMKPVTKKYGAAENLLPRTLLFFFNDSFCRADVLTGAAFRTFFLTDNILISSLFNSIRRTFFCTGSTGNTVISYFESHEPITSLPFNSNTTIKSIRTPGPLFLLPASVHHIFLYSCQLTPVPLSGL